MFKKNKILSETEIISQLLKQARRSKKISIENVAKDLKINPKYLLALEKGEYQSLPKGFYGRRFLKEYAHYLGINSNDIEDIFSQKSGLESSSIFSQPVLKEKNFLIFPKIIKIFVIITVTAAVFLYLGFSLKKVIAPPKLIVLTPQDNMVVFNNYINVLGETEEGAEITINKELVSNNKGFFSKKISLKKGINTIIITAKKRYRGEKTITRQILMKNN